MFALPLRDGLWFIVQDIAKPPPHAIPTQMHHVILLDRSGSMHWTIRDLVSHVEQRISSLPDGDLVSIGWFSSPGEYRFLVKGYRCDFHQDPPATTRLHALLDPLRSTLGTTCFSDILMDTHRVLQDLASLTPRCTLTLFTDGCPVVPNYRDEERAIFDALALLSPRLCAAWLIGYGNYYNKELMTRMAAALGGSLSHANSIPTFALQMDHFLTDARMKTGGMLVNLEAPVSLGIPFSINGTQIVMYEPQAGERSVGVAVYYVPQVTGTNRLFYLTHSLPESVKLMELAGLGNDGVTLILDNASYNIPVEPVVQGLYAAAYMLTQQGKTGEALEILGKIGDVALIDAVNNCFTLEEYGATEQQLQVAMWSPTQRFLRGRDTHYLPKSDVFCVLDALDLLMQDDHAYFYPLHPDFRYRRIGIAHTQADDAPVFTPTQDVQCAFNTLVWHQKLLNLSVTARIPGTVPLGDDAFLFGCENPYATHIYRTYTLVRDGFLWTSRIPVSCSLETYTTLQHAGVIDRDDFSWSEGAVVTLHLDQLPVMNRAMASQHITARELCVAAIEEQRLMGILKVLRHELDAVTTQREEQGLTPAQETYLAQYCIGKNGFRPPQVEIPTTDFYLVKAFELKGKGLSSLPSVEHVSTKLGTDKKLTLAESLIADGIRYYSAYVAGHPDISTDVTIAHTWLQSAITTHKQALLQTRRQIQRTKFAVLLGRRWFNDLATRADTTVVVDGIEWRLEIRDDVRIDI